MFPLAALLIAMSLVSEPSKPKRTRPKNWVWTEEDAERARTGTRLLKGGKVLSEYGQRGGATHRGIDVAAKKGTVVRAPLGGVVRAVSPDGERRGYGNTVILRHTDGTGTLYAHLDGFAPGLKVGAWVSAGSKLGTVGQTQLPKGAMRSRPHLHFEALANVPARGRPVVNRDTMRLKPRSWLARWGVEV